MTRDFYELLGVDEDASKDEIRDAFRDMVQEYHPDRNDDPRATAQFTIIKKAYDTLKDPNERQSYDRLGHTNYVAKRLDGIPDPSSWPSEDEEDDESDTATETTSSGRSSEATGSSSGTRQRSDTTTGSTAGSGTTTSSTGHYSRSSSSTRRTAGTSSTTTGSSNTGGGSASSNSSNRSSASSEGSRSNSTTGSTSGTSSSGRYGGASGTTTDTSSSSTTGRDRSSSAGTSTRNEGTTSRAANGATATGAANAAATGGASASTTETTSASTANASTGTTNSTDESSTGGSSGLLFGSSAVQWLRSKRLGWRAIILSFGLYLAGLTHYGYENLGGIERLVADLQAAGTDVDALQSVFLMQASTYVDPAWQYVYVTDPAEIGPSIVFALGTVLMPIVFFLAIRRTRRHRGRNLSYLFALAVLVPVVVLAVTGVGSVYGVIDTIPLAVVLFGYGVVPLLAGSVLIGRRFVWTPLRKAF